MNILYPNASGHQSSILHILDDIVQNPSNDTSWVVTRLMRKLKSNDPDNHSFRYKCDKNDMVEGLMWQNSYGRASLPLHGSKGFFDMRLSEGMNTLRYVYVAWVVIDGNNRFIPASEGILLRESDDLYKFAMLATIDMTPGFTAEDIRFGWADDRLCPIKVKTYLPNLILYLDTYHFIVGEKGVCILSKDFGNAWSLVKDHFHGAVYADTEEQCMVRLILSNVPNLLPIHSQKVNFLKLSSLLRHI